MWQNIYTSSSIFPDKYKYWLNYEKIIVELGQGNIEQCNLFQSLVSETYVETQLLWEIWGGHILSVQGASSIALTRN